MNDVRTHATENSIDKEVALTSKMAEMPMRLDEMGVQICAEA